MGCLLLGLCLCFKFVFIVCMWCGILVLVGKKFGIGIFWSVGGMGLKVKGIGVGSKLLLWWFGKCGNNLVDGRLGLRLKFWGKFFVMYYFIFWSFFICLFWKENNDGLFVLDNFFFWDFWVK